MDAKVRVALDTNIWSYIADAGVAAEFEKFVSGSQTKVVIPPSVLLEALRHPKAEVRQRIVDAMCRAAYQKLPSEAELESREIIAEVRRCRPNMLRQFPNTGRTATFHAFWTHRIWREAKANPEVFYDKQTETPSTSKKDWTVETQKINRKNLLRDGDGFDATDLSHMLITTDDPSRANVFAPGWDGSHVDAWRFENLGIYRYEIFTISRRAAVTGEDTTFADWLGAYVDLPRLTKDPEGFTKFWFTEIEKARVPRHWLRWAVRQAQMSMKVTGGNPYDDQHSSYLLDCDIFLTADRAFHRALQLVHKHSDFEFSESRLVSGDSRISILDRVQNTLQR